MSKRKNIVLLLTTLLCLPSYGNIYSEWHLLKSHKAPNNDPFSVNNEIVNPFCVSKLVTAPSDPFPTIASVDLNGCQISHTNLRKIYQNQKNTYLIFYNNNDRHKGYFDYQVIGRTINGLYVIKTSDGRGNRGTFTKIQIIKLGKDHVYHYRNPNPSGNSKTKQLNIRTRETMTLVGEIEGAKGCNYGIKEASLSGNTLTVGFYINSEDFQNLKTIHGKKIDTALNNKAEEYQCVGTAYFQYNLQSLSEPSFVRVSV